MINWQKKIDIMIIEETISYPMILADACRHRLFLEIFNGEPRFEE